MATLSALAEIVASVLGIDRERVEAIARAVREDGLIATHGRGTSAAHMSEADAANLLIAVNTADTARGAAEAVRRFRALRANNKEKNEFGRVLEGMIGAAMRRELVDYLLSLGFGPVGAEREKQRNALNTFVMKIEFELSRPMVFIQCSMPSTGMPKPLPFYPASRKGVPRSKVDRRTTISHRTVLEVAKILQR